jgi:S-adenosylmethionine-diacylglycerol 3-amino-3-carboxypropyl transferase
VKDAQGLPLAFAWVREDTLQDVALVRALVAEGRAVRALAIASGGCTAAALAREPGVAALHLVDANPAQLALARLKLGLLERSPEERRALLGLAALPPAERRPGLEAAADTAGVDLAAIGPVDRLVERGPDRCGRFEVTFAALRSALGDLAPWRSLLLEPDARARGERLAALGPRLLAAFREVFALPNLVAVFGPDATANRAQPFADHFHAQVSAALVDPARPSATNPYLWDVLLGELPPGAGTPWLDLPPGAATAAVTWEQTSVQEALAATDAEFDYLHLSNVLDWLSPEAARETLRLAAGRLRPDGLLVVRQLNSTLDVAAAAPPNLVWDRLLAAELHPRDRSAFYRALFVGRPEG